MKINWKVRMRNPLFWGQIAIAIISPILVGLGMQWQDMTNWQTLGSAIMRAIQNPVIVLSIIGSVVTAVTDPTTEGIGDSRKALTYLKPKKKDDDS